jgi:hypothetical protein
MLQEAALFHTQLYHHLAPHGLTIKDCHPYNVLFRGPQPVLVDFTSIIPHHRLLAEPYLTPPHVPLPFRPLWSTTSAYVHELYARTFVPYFLLPLYMMRQRRFRETRQRMLETALNASHDTLSRREALPRVGRFWLCYAAFLVARRLALIARGEHKRLFWRLVGTEIRRLRVAVRESAYTDYYRAKDEDLPFEPSPSWTAKQRVILESIESTRPDTVLDVAGNIGWFSILAARQGCEVVCLDVDEACMNVLYDTARTEGLSILPLVMDVSSTTPAVEPIEHDGEEIRSLVGGTPPLMLAAPERLRSDMVLALGILHHLALGQGLGLDDIVVKLGALTGRHLLLEFVARDDDLITAEPDFFPALADRPSDFDWYTQDTVVAALEHCFSEVRVEASHPSSRKILICSR